MPVQVSPLAQARPGQVFALTQPAQPIFTQGLALLLAVAPQLEQGHEIRARIAKARVALLGLAAVLGGSLARVLNRQRAGQHQQFREHAVMLRGQQHTRQRGIDGQRRHAPTQGRKAARVQRAQLLQKPVAIAHPAPIGGIDKGKLVHVAEAEMLHAQHHRRQIAALDFRVGKRRPGPVILLAVQAQTHPRTHPSTAAATLIGTGPGHRLDGQALDAAAVRVAADARLPRIDDVANPRHGHGGFRHIGRQHHAQPGTALAGQHARLLGLIQTRIQGLHIEASGAAQAPGGIADIALRGEKHQHIPRLAVHAIAHLAHRARHLFGRVLVSARLAGQILGAHRVAAPGDLDDRRVVEVAGKTLHIDRRAGDDDFQIRTPRAQAFEVTEDEIDIETALVRFVDNQRVVLAQLAIALQLAQQDAVGHDLNGCRRAHRLVKANLIADQFA